MVRGAMRETLGRGDVLHARGGKPRVSGSAFARLGVGRDRRALLRPPAAEPTGGCQASSPRLVIASADGRPPHGVGDASTYPRNAAGHSARTFEDWTRECTTSAMKLEAETV